MPTKRATTPVPPDDRKATIFDVARAAGVSKTTVSRVLTGSTNVSSRTRTRVLDAVDRMDYRVNVAARSLRTARSSLVGLLVPAISNDVFGRIAEVLEEELRREGTGVTIMSSGWSPEGEALALQMLRSRGLDAVVASLVNDRGGAVGDALRSLGVPVILLDREVRGVGTDVVFTDQRSGVQAAVQHLAELGHRSIGLATLTPSVRPGREATAAFAESVSALGLPSLESVVVRYADVAAQAGWSAAERLVEQGATAILCCVPNSVTAGVLEFLRARGLAVPRDVSLIAFDESELASVKPPRLTVISRPLEEIARHAGRMVTTRLATPDLPPRVAIVQMTLHVQDSTSPPRASKSK
ncbi:MAG: LacI family DNA-binding transcriptional regulator [Gaiellaceae bacterium]